MVKRIHSYYAHDVHHFDFAICGLEMHPLTVGTHAGGCRGPTVVPMARRVKHASKAAPILVVVVVVDDVVSTNNFAFFLFVVRRQ